VAGSEPELPQFERRFFGADSPTRIGSGSIGGKAQGLVRARQILELGLDRSRYPGLAIDIPRMVVLGADLFDAFVARNGLVRDPERSDDRTARVFQRGSLPVEILGDLRAIVEGSRLPLAVRSSSLLEDALDRPFAGVYQTKMIPNFEAAADARFERLVEAVKFVYASTWFGAARDYARVAGSSDADEKMAVVVQEVVGQRHDRRYYPLLSGVARSFHWYPIAPARPEDGVVDLALGLGKTIVDGGRCWSYSPSRPAAAPPYGSVAERVQGTQTTFWAIRLDRPTVYDPTVETEYLVELPLDAADYDDTLRHVASTYDAAADRLRPGTGRPGPKVVDFAPILALDAMPLNAVVRDVLSVLGDEIGAAVEVEFALSESRFGLVQVRPMVTLEEVVEVTDAELASPAAVVASERVLGNGVDPKIHDVVYVLPERFDPLVTRTIAREIAARNRELVDQARPYVLIGFGRWGSVDPSLGIPVAWSDVGGARVIVEATLPRIDVEPSQGSHFFHNLSSFRVSYFMVHHAERPIDWDWLARQTVVAQTEHVRHVRISVPVSVRVDGRTGRGVILAGGR
jgi:hypothetical protein